MLYDTLIQEQLIEKLDLKIKLVLFLYISFNSVL